MRTNTMILLALVLTLATTSNVFAQAATKATVPAFTNTQLADQAVKELLQIQNKVEKEYEKEFSILGRGRETEQTVQRRVRMSASDTISNFAGTINRHHPSLQEVCATTKLLDGAVKRFIESRLGPNASPMRKEDQFEELLRQVPAVEVVYTTMGACTSLMTWIPIPDANKRAANK